MPANVRFWLLPTGNAEAQAFVEDSFKRVLKPTARRFHVLCVHLQTLGYLSGKKWPTRRN